MFFELSAIALSIGSCIWNGANTHELLEIRKNLKRVNTVLYMQLNKNPIEFTTTGKEYLLNGDSNFHFF